MSYSRLRNRFQFSYSVKSKRKTRDVIFIRFAWLTAERQNALQQLERGGEREFGSPRSLRTLKIPSFLPILSPAGRLIERASWERTNVAIANHITGLKILSSRILKATNLRCHTVWSYTSFAVQCSSCVSPRGEALPPLAVSFMVFESRRVCWVLWEDELFSLLIPK